MDNQIRALRKALGLSQEELAKACGVSRQTINAIENNKYDPTLALAFHLAKTLAPRWTNCSPPRHNSHTKKKAGTKPCLPFPVGYGRFKVCPGTPWPRPD